MNISSIHLHLTTKEASMKSGSLRENLIKEINESFDDICDSVEFIIRMVKDGESRENIIEYLEQFERKLLK